MSSSATSPDASRTFTGAAIDAHHSGHRSAVVVGPLDLPDANCASQRLIRFAKRGPHTRIGLVPSHDRRAWSYAPDRLADAVHTAPPTDDPLALLDLVAALPPRHLRVVLSGRYLAIDYDHGLGDTTLLNTIVDVLLSEEIPETIAASPRWWTPTRALAIAGAAVLSNPRRLRALAHMHRSRDYRAPQPSTLVPVDPPRQATSVFARTPRDVVDSMRAARTSRASGVGMFTLHTVALVRALTAAGLRVNPMVTLPFDARAYLPRSVGTMANFAAGLDFVVLPDTAPDALQAELSAASSMGRPVANLLVTAAKSRAAARGQRRRRVAATGQQSWAPAGEAAIDLLHSSGGVVPGRNQRWNFSDTEKALVIGIAEPPSPTGITVTSASVAGSLCLTATFRDDVFPADAVAAALADVPAQALAVLGETIPAPR
ncbi:hypothetical protein [Gordonia sp. 852002-10350_SCH5691597]|uniref:hypothetical protein n=1 Tax=Gordonia sp. 852002-10350_SCH5691597 TaxID=1834085 RepID=UPI0007EB8C4C|nr:hypothetical protein [Gordonia sp. 852002-10350_SCH5691597]OBA74295.1 hypothetical protein A5777_09155 [Gordonia sp. 852002-10350_SCH5691597]